MDLKIKIEEKEGGNSLTVSLAGSLDTDTYIQFEKRMAEALNLSVKGVILNMEGLTYISSIGFAAIFRIKQALEKNGGTLAVANLEPNVKKIFDAIKVIPESIFATLQEADDYLDRYIAFINSQAGKKE
jgi:anti-anti-sigma factor